MHLALCVPDGPSVQLCVTAQQQPAASKQTAFPNREDTGLDYGF